MVLTACFFIRVKRRAFVGCETIQATCILFQNLDGKLFPRILLFRRVGIDAVNGLNPSFLLGFMSRSLQKYG